jgi:hypothetical protein
MKNRLVVLAHENNIDLNFIKQYSSEYNKNCLTYHQIFTKSNLTDATSGVETANPSKGPEFILKFFVRFMLFNLQFFVYDVVDHCLSF